MVTLIMMMMTKPYDYDDTDDDHDFKNDSYTAAGAAPGASVPCSLFLALWSRPSGPGLGIDRGISILVLPDESWCWLPGEAPDFLLS